MEERDVEDLWHNNVLIARVFFRIIEHLLNHLLNLSLGLPQENRINWLNLIKNNNLLIDLSPWDEPFAHWLSRQTCLSLPLLHLFTIVPFSVRKLFQLNL